MSFIDVIKPYNTDVKIRNIPRSSILYAKRAYYWKSNSGEFLSGDVFADAADINVFPPRYRSPKPTGIQVSEAKVIFCPSHYVEEFFSDYKGKINARILILGNSDRDFLEPIQNVPNSIKKIFCQNLNFDDTRYEVLPIGVENTRLATNGKKELLSSNFAAKTKKMKILVGPLSRTHSERLEILNANYSSNLIVQKNDRMTPMEYANLSSEFKFIAAPRGNGIDTHRFWETLYRGGIPIVKSSPWIVQIKKLNIPVIEVESWLQEDLIDAIQKNTELSFPAIRDTAQLWWPWWESRLRGNL